MGGALQEQLSALISATLPSEQLEPLQECQRELQLAADPESSAAAYFNLAVEADALPSGAGLELAVQAYLASVALAPDDADTHYNLALCYDALGPERAEEAVASYRRAVALEPSQADAWTNLGLQLKQAGNIDGAVAAHKAAFDLEPALMDGYAVRLLGLETAGAFGAEAVAAGPGGVGGWEAALQGAAALLRTAGYGDRTRMVASL